jgi:NAD(P)H-hydrate repair Nnr-like enzyme with NAD(P)H-hydrate dehydratase domain
VKVLCPPDAAPVLAPTLEAVMLDVFHDPLDLERLAGPMDAVVIGPAAGVDEATVLNMAALERTGAALVLDADALTVFAGRAEQLAQGLDRDDVVTPHAGEFERLFPGWLERVGREAAAVEAAATLGCVVVLKAGGASWLATAGSGDVLAGMIGGLLAQSMDSFDAAGAAVGLHAEAARRFGPGLVAEDLPGLLPPLLAERLDGAGPSP